MSITVARMTKEELREMIESIVERKLIEILSESDSLLGRHLSRSRRTASGTLVAAEPDEAIPGKIVDKDGVLVIRGESPVDLTDVRRHEQERRVADFSRRVKS